MANARKKAQEARELLALGVDPKAHRDELRQAKLAKTEHTFEKVATAWFELKKHSITTAYAEDIWRSLTLHVFPSLKATPLADITAPMIIKLLRPIEAKGSLKKGDLKKGDGFIYGKKGDGFIYWKIDLSPFLRFSAFAWGTKGISLRATVARATAFQHSSPFSNSTLSWQY